MILTGVINPDNIQGLENRRRRSADNVRPARQATTEAALVSVVTLYHPLIVSVILSVVELCDIS